MEYCSGGELFEKILKNPENVFGESEACDVMDKLFHAIAHCHANGIAHRDIKPENIMIGKDKEIKLIDFGLSAIGNDRLKHFHSIAGTAFYMAPEIIKGEYSYPADLWALGVLMYLLLSGYLPF